jgi:hypothetical protein
MSQCFLTVRFVHLARAVYGEFQVAVTDAQFKIGVGVGGLALVVVISTVQFCGSVSLPPKPEPKVLGSTRQLLTKGTESPAVYQDFLSKDAISAGVRLPSVEEMGRKLPYRVDEARHVLEVGQPAIELAGLKLRAQRSGNALVLQIDNMTSSDLGYAVTTSPTPNITNCSSARALAFNAMVLTKGGSETRVECVWREGMALAVTKVETLEISPLSAWYLSLVPPTLVGIDERISRGHRPSESSEKCSTAVSQAVRSGLERGEIGWRDLVDFYARHRCTTYRFPLSYRAFKFDEERTLPAVGAGM